MKRWLMAMLTAGALGAQSPPSFDAASVKASHGPRPSSLTMLHVSMGYCIRFAYGIRTAYELIGPGWLDPPTENEFDIAAKIERPVDEDAERSLRPDDSSIPVGRTCDCTCTPFSRSTGGRQAMSGSSAANK
jgi:hypothetical protein